MRGSFVFALAALVLMSNAARGDPPAVVKTLIRQEIDLDCRAFNEHARTVGVKVPAQSQPGGESDDADEAGQPNQSDRTSAGATVGSIHVDAKWKGGWPEKGPFSCCGKPLQQKLVDCLGACPRLECINRCQPAELCYVANVDFQISLTVQPYGVSWKPPAGASKACVAEKERFDRELRAHEERHVADERAILDELRGEATKRKRVESCVPIPEGASEEIKQNLKTEALKEVDEIQDWIIRRYYELSDAKREAIHAAHGVGWRELDCSQCPSP